ncbi:MAG: ATP-binding cassette domain-containing protein [Erysipelotrichaceae bacterium]
MDVVTCQNINKKYVVKRTEPGLKNALHSFFNPHYQTIQAVDNVNFCLERSRILGMIGENGAGKTTIIKLLCGILAPDSGIIKVLGRDPFEKKSEFKKKISLVLGNKNQLWWDLPAHESFIITKKLYGLSDDEYEKSLNELVNVMEIESFINTPVKNLSLGQRMRCELVNSLLFNPELILMDEPTLGLDYRSQALIRNYIRKYVVSHNASCIVTSHYIKDITDLTTDVLILHKGEVIFSSPTEDFLKLCSQNSIIEVDDFDAGEKLEKRRLNFYSHNDSFRMFVDSAEVSDIMKILLDELKLKTVKIVDASIEDLVENSVLSFQSGEGVYE